LPEPRIILSGGGTGGHVFPAVAVAAEIRRLAPRAALLFVGRRDGMEKEAARAAGIDYAWVPTQRLNALGAVRLLMPLWPDPPSVRQSKAILATFKPTVVLGTGGYVSVAPVLAACSLGVPAAIHEQNAIPGRANRFLSLAPFARCVRKIMLSFEPAMRSIPRSRAVLTGLPVRREIVEPRTKADARRELGLDPDAATLLVLGGSQGAQAINELVVAALPGLLGSGLQILHHCGAEKFDEMCRQAQLPEHASYHPFRFSNEIWNAYRSADVVVARAGASTVAEILCCGLPSILIPYPFSPTGDQRANAGFVAESGAGATVEQSSLTPEVLSQMVLSLVGDSERREAMSRAALSLARPDAAKRVAEIVLELSGSE
jgi:UDP-N-acetylglucosamine--N-acetylmuramyl-(pentapeptide) pyrophosphoryl-undecaprenol N-acetylglucosamine transferase